MNEDDRSLGCALRLGQHVVVGELAGGEELVFNPGVVGSQRLGVHD